MSRPPPVPADLPALPRDAAGFSLRRELGRGGMGVVYEAQEIATGRTVALKVLLQELALSDEAMERFQREARLAAAISHAHCVFVYGAHTVEGAPAIAMELIGGETLEDKIRRGEPIPVETAVRWTIDLLDGLDAAHRAGVLHRDIKPSNCFVSMDGRLKVGDFGLSRSLERDIQLTQSGQFLGSPLYASPEQIRGRTLDARSDLYSCGATLYAILTGQPPFSGGNVGEVLARILSEEPPHPRSIRPSIPRALEVVVLRAMERDPEKRWSSLQEFREALEPFASTRTEVGAPLRRVGAYLIDFFLPVLVVMPALSVLPIHMVDMQTPAGHVFSGSLNILYFVLMEGLLGWSLGKWMFGLRVASVETREPALLGAAIRALVFLGPNILIGFALVKWLHPPTPSDAGFLQAAVSALWYVLVFLSARRRNGWRGLHEFASNTVVIPASLPFLRARLQAPPPEMQLETSANLPAQIGAYAVEGVVGATPSGSMLKARDATLERSVWIHVPTVSGSLADGGRRSLTRSARLRWLDVVRTESGDADVFESPGGSSLPVFSQRHGSIDWPNAQRLMLALVEELSVGPTDARGLALEQVWIDRNWDVRLLDEPVGHGPFMHLPPLDVVHEAARALFVGHKENAPILPVDLPVHAEEAVGRLMGSDRRFEDLGSIREALLRLSAGPARVLGRTRASQLAINVMLPAAMAALIIVFVLVVLGTIPRMQGIMPMSVELAKGQLIEESSKPLRPDVDLAAIDIKYGEPLTADQVRAREILVADACDTFMGGAFVSNKNEVVRVAVQTARDHVKQVQPSDIAWAEQVVQAETGYTAKHRHEIDVQTGERGQTHIVGSEDDVEPFRHDFPPIAAMVSVGIWGGIAIPLAFALRGGLTFLLFGIRVRDGRGRRAARWLCCVRCVLAWLPLAGASFAVWVLCRHDQTMAASILAIVVGGIYVAALVDAILRPARCVVDLVLRTRLVPR